MVEALLWIICAAGAFLAFAFLWGMVEILLGTGRSRQKRDPTLNAFQQPLRRDGYPVRNFDR